MRKVNIPMVLACVLLLLTMISIHLTSGLYARYTTTATASDKARVAKFDVKTECGKDITVDCSLSQKSDAYTLTVYNQSEVAVQYTMIITLDKAVSGTDMYMQLAEKGDQKFYTDVNKPTEYRFTNIKELGPNEYFIHEIFFGVEKWHTVTGKTNPNETAPESFDWELNFDIVIDVWQVD